MEGQKERPILDTVEVQSVTPTHEIEGSYERSLVAEKGPVDEVGGGAIL